MVQVFFASSNARRRPRSSSTRRTHRRNPVVSFRTGCSPAKGQKVECCSLPFIYSREWDPKRGSQSAFHRVIIIERYDARGKNAIIFDERCERDIDFDERRRHFLTVLLTENSYSPTGSCDRTLIDSRLSSSSSPMSNAGDASSVVGAAPTPSRKEDL